MIASEAGTLELAINDTILSDTSGHYCASITIDPAK